MCWVRQSNALRLLGKLLFHYTEIKELHRADQYLGESCLPTGVNYARKYSPVFKKCCDKLHSIEDVVRTIEASDKNINDIISPYLSKTNVSLYSERGFTYIL